MTVTNWDLIGLQRAREMAEELGDMIAAEAIDKAIDRAMKALRPKRKKVVARCPDCGEPGERKGHQTCQYPQD